jgi:hypothetical protein
VDSKNADIDTFIAGVAALKTSQAPR